MKCIICSGKIEFLDNYRFNLKSDQNHLGDLKIYHCNNCDFAFTNPMPERKKLNNYYQSIYRSGGRHHEIGSNLHLEYLSDRNLSYFSYLSSFINFEKIKDIFDYGAGNGNLGYLIKKKFNHINLHSIELSKTSSNILNSRNYKLYSNFKEIDKKFDLIISTRVIQQLTNLNIFESFRKISNKNTFVFLDLPNNEFKDKFFQRPYDTPGLIFFTKKSFSFIARKFDIEVKNISYSSYSLDQAYIFMSQSKKKVLSKNNKKFLDIGKIIKKIVPKKILEIKHLIHQFKERDLLIEEFMLNKSESWMFKVLFNWK